MNISIKRNLNFLNRIVLRVIAYGGMCLAICIGMGILGGNSVSDIKNDAGFVIGYINLFIVLVFGLTITTSYMPSILSFGTPRKYYFISKNIASAGLIMVAIVFDVIVLFATDDFESKKLLLYIAQMIGLTGVGNVLGNLIWKFGMKGYVAFCFFCGLIGGIAAGFSGSSTFKKIFGLSYIGYVAVALSMLVYIAASFAEWKMIEKFEIK